MIGTKSYISKLKRFNFSQETEDLFKSQIKLFSSYNNKNFTKYNVGDEVLLDNNYLIHGSRATLEELKTISEIGLIASEFYSDTPIKKKKPYVIELWQVKEKINLKYWLEKYTGVTIDFYDSTGQVYKSEVSSFNNLKRVIKKQNGYRDYIIYQNQEQRFLPNELSNNACSVAFIVKYSKDDILIKNNIFDQEFSKNISKELLPNWYFEKYILNKDYDKAETNREKAIIFGIPPAMIEGIIVSDKLKNNKDYLKIQKIFSKCYICDRKGQVLSVPKK